MSKTIRGSLTVLDIKSIANKKGVELPFFTARVQAGFPSPGAVSYTHLTLPTK